METSKKFREAQRGVTRVAIRNGNIKKNPCAMCGGKHVMAHHPNYYKPFDVVWLCASCHTNHHARMRFLSKEAARGSSTATLESLRPLRREAVETGNTEALRVIDREINHLSLRKES